MNSEQSESSTCPPGHRIVVGYVHIHDCELALDRALELARREPGSVVHVVRAIPLAERVEITALDEAFERVRDDTLDAIARASDRVGARPPVHVDLSFGDPARTIAAAAKRVAATLVIIGHGSEGRVARALSSRLRCALLVATADRYSAPELATAAEVAAPDEPDRKLHTYTPDDVFEQSTYRIGPTRIY